MKALGEMATSWQAVVSSDCTYLLQSTRYGISQQNPLGKVVRLKADQVFCSFNPCGMPACFAVYRNLGLQRREVRAYCKSHAEEVASDCGLEMPE